MHAFARVESHINLELNNFVLIRIGPRQPGGDLIVDAILGPARIAALMDTIKRLLRVTKASKETKDEIDSIFNHLGEINGFRDAIVHNAAYPANCLSVTFRLEFSARCAKMLPSNREGIACCRPIYRPTCRASRRGSAPTSSVGTIFSRRAGRTASVAQVVAMPTPIVTRSV